MNNIENGIKDVEDTTTTLKEELTATTSVVMGWEVGTLNTNGSESTSTTRARCAFVPTIANQTVITINVTRQTGLAFYLYFYDYGKNLLYSDGTYWSTFIELGTTIEIPVAFTGYVRIVARVRYDNPVTDEILTEIDNSVVINTNIITSAKKTETNTENIDYIEKSIVDGLLPDVGTWEQGGLSNVALNTTNANRIRTQGGIELRKGDSVYFKANGQLYYWYLLQDGIVYQNSTAWISTDSIINIERDSYLRITVSKTNQSTDITPSERTCTASVYSAIAKRITGLHLYNGREVDLSEHSYNASVFMTIPSVVGLQGGAKYDEEFFVFTNSRSINVYNVSGELLGSFTPPLPESAHGNTLCFADGLHDGNAQYPYLYVSSYYNQNAFFVLDITESNGVYSATLAQTIAFNPVSTDIIGSGYSDFAVDWQNRIFYMIRYKTASTYQDVEGNVQVISAWSLPTITETKVFQADELLFRFEVPDLIFARQQCVYHNGNIYIPAGSGGVNGRQKLYVLSVADKAVVTVIDISEALDYTEPEAFIIYDNSCIIFNAGNKNVYQLRFVN